ncbi:MAG: hypothetical protein ACYDCN_16610 [Bacteroidia bacterium]
MKKIILVSLIVSSCALFHRTEKEMNMSLQQNTQYLMMNYGAPTEKVSDGGDGEIWVYATNIYRAPYTLYGSSGASTYVPSSNYWQYKMFYVNKQKIVYHWLYKTETIPPQRIDMSIYQNVNIHQSH